VVIQVERYQRSWLKQHRHCLKNNCFDFVYNKKTAKLRVQLRVIIEEVAWSNISIFSQKKVSSGARADLTNYWTNISKSTGAQLRD
tara:strand:+ start:306 stop:563 length:258 start_codon:yes stop_codon:yes gene_type:complete